MSERAVSTIAEQLSTNLFNRLTNGPRWGTVDDFKAVLNEEARNILAALKAARIAVVPLADPLEREDGEDEIADTWERVGEFRVSVHDAYPDEVALSYDFEPYEPFSPREARELAAELLAAADVADAAAVGARITVEEA
ncbi:hypothetical protein H8Z60_19915 [Mycolicibacterium fortuitum]|nr:hypothetical protein [Mycolicibacterium fortuitum]